MIIEKFKRVLSRRRKGTIALLAVVSMVPVTAMFSANMNTGQMVDDRRQVQDASDAIATMHATWTARSLNVISMNNVTSTQLLTVAIGSEALAGTLTELRITAGLALGQIAIHALSQCAQSTGEAITTAIWAAYCTGQHALVAIPAGTALIDADQIENDFDPDHGVKVSHKALRAIEGMNRAIVSRFPRAMAEIGKEYARVHGIDDFHFADPCNGYGTQNCTTSNTNVGMALPLDLGGTTERLERCAAMEVGTTVKFTTFRTRGFPIGKGPMSHGGSSSNRRIKDHINLTTGIHTVLKDFKDFYQSSRSNMVVAFNPIPTDPFQQWANLQLTQSRNNNSFTRLFDLKYGGLCTGISVPLLGLQATIPTLWKLKGISSVSLPKVQPDQMPDAFRILTFAQMDKSRRLSSQLLTDGVTSHFGYAQVGVYNPDGADLYSQNWRFRMMPATRMDNPQKVAGDLRSQAHAIFRPLADSLGAVSDLTSWGRVNAH